MPEVLVRQLHADHPERLAVQLGDPHRRLAGEQRAQFLGDHLFLFRVGTHRGHAELRVVALQFELEVHRSRQVAEFGRPDADAGRGDRAGRREAFGGSDGDPDHRGKTVLQQFRRADRVATRPGDHCGGFGATLSSDICEMHFPLIKERRDSRRRFRARQFEFQPVFGKRLPR